MIDPKTMQLWLYRLGFVSIAALALFLGLLPIDIGEMHWHAPDFILAFACAWVLRRPSYVPLVILFLALLLADFIFTRPPGLWALLSLLGVEFLRSREAFSRDMPFLVEWAIVSCMLLAMALAYRVILAIFVVDSTSLGLVILQQISTVLTYPLVVAISIYVLKITKITAAEADLAGHAR